MNSIKVIPKLSINEMNSTFLRSHATMTLSSENGVVVNTVEPRNEKMKLDENYLKIYGVKFIDQKVYLDQVNIDTDEYLFFIEIRQYNIINGYNNIGHIARLIDKHNNEIWVQFDNQVLKEIVFDMRATWGILAGYKKDWDVIWPKLIFTTDAGSDVTMHCLNINGELRSVSDGVMGIQQILEELVFGQAKSFYPS